MNKEQTKECIKVMQAFVDGEEIVDNTAAPMLSPHWSWLNDEKMYEINPREYWVGVFSGVLYTSDIVSISESSCIGEYAHNPSFIKAIQLVEKDEN